jgi:AcrR family transcriptional regulator
MTIGHFKQKSKIPLADANVFSILKSKGVSAVGTQLDKQKEEKKSNILASAFELFLQKGIVKTSIDDIVQKANVAKGTFYLYFKDKTDILQKLVYQTSRYVLSEAYEAACAQDTGDFVENVILLADYVVEYFKKNKLVLKLMERNFSWPLLEKELTQAQDPLWNQLQEQIHKSPLAQKYTSDEIFKLIFVLIEMCGSVCYSSIIEEKPDTIDHMKPVLYSIIRKSLS